MGTSAGEKRRDAGFSLIELVVGIAVAGIVMAAVLPFFRANVGSYIRVRAGKDMMQSARIGFNRMLAEMNEITSSIEIDYGYSTQIQFDTPDENNINYAYTSGQLKREGVRLVNGVRSFQITYYLENGSVKGTPFSSDSDVWRIRIQMEVGDDQNKMLLRAEVSPRNIHYD